MVAQKHQEFLWNEGIKWATPKGIIGHTLLGGAGTYSSELIKTYPSAGATFIGISYVK